MELTDLKIIVTGAASGMGAYFTRQLVAAGAQVAAGDIDASCEPLAAVVVAPVRQKQPCFPSHPTNPPHYFDRQRSNGFDSRRRMIVAFQKLETFVIRFIVTISLLTNVQKLSVKN